MCIKVYHHSMNSQIDICVLYIDIYLQYIDPRSFFCFRHAYCIVLLWPWEATIYEFRLVYYMTCSQADVSWDRFNFECFNWRFSHPDSQIHRVHGVFSASDAWRWYWTMCTRKMHLGLDVEVWSPWWRDIHIYTYMFFIKNFLHNDEEDRVVDMYYLMIRRWSWQWWMMMLLMMISMIKLHCT